MNVPFTQVINKHLTVPHLAVQHFDGDGLGRRMKVIGLLEIIRCLRLGSRRPVVRQRDSDKVRQLKNGIIIDVSAPPAETHTFPVTCLVPRNFA